MSSTWFGCSAKRMTWANSLRFYGLFLLAGGIMASSTPARPSKKTASHSPYAAWKNGLPHDPGYFPIAVWLQSPENAGACQKAGFNLYVGLWQGPTEDQLQKLKAAGMGVICEQNETGLEHRSDPTIQGWMHGDEPDNAQSVRDPKTGNETYGPPVPPARIVSDYQKIKANDPTRPVLLNLGQGVANDEWVGRGSGASINDYPEYVKGCDLVSFDVYPVAGLDKPHPEDYLWYVPKGVSRLVGWTGGKKTIWNCIECTHIGDANRKPTPAQVRSEVWMAIIHGSGGLIYFVHQFAPKFNEHALLDDPEMLAAVTALNRQIRGLAPVLNSPTLPNAASASSSSAAVPVDLMAKQFRGDLYIFAAGMRNAETKAAFTVQKPLKAATVEVLGENRRLKLTDGRFEDDFAPYAIHLYWIHKATGGQNE